MLQGSVSDFPSKTGQVRLDRALLKVSCKCILSLKWAGGANWQCRQQMFCRYRNQETLSLTTLSGIVNLPLIYLVGGGFSSCENQLARRGREW